MRSSLFRTLTMAVLTGSAAVRAGGGEASAASTARPAPGRVDSSATAPATWKIDPAHSELSFRIRHLLSRTQGRFNRWGGTIVADPDNFASATISVEIETGSIDTNNERRDTHLRSADFFAAEQHPRITFQSRRVQLRGREMVIHGDLSMRGVTKPVVLRGRLLGITKGGDGKRVAAFEAETTINRQEFAVSWNNAAEAGNLLGDEVAITMAIEAKEQPAAAPSAASGER